MIPATDIIKFFESCKLKTYKDAVGVLTIGWGSTGSDIVEGLVWTQEQADARLAYDVARTQTAVEHLTHGQLKPNELQALVSFAYNVGIQALATSTLLRKILSGDFDVTDEFTRWDHAGGRVLQGLLARRTIEAALFAGYEDKVRQALVKH